MNKRANYNARAFAAWIKTLRKRECQQCKGSYLSEKKPLRTQLFKHRLFAGRHGEYIWLVHVIFPHVQMTCQLLLNYTRHLDQSAQCQRWLILFIVAVMTVLVDTERHTTHNKGLWEGLGEGCRDRTARARVDWLNDCLSVHLALDFYRWRSDIIKISDGNHFISRKWKWLEAQHLTGKKQKKL